MKKINSCIESHHNQIQRLDIKFYAHNPQRLPNDSTVLNVGK